jgi:hypothetical protein
MTRYQTDESGTREARGVLQRGVDPTKFAKGKAAPMTSRESDKPIAARKPGNAGGAKGLTSGGHTFISHRLFELRAQLGALARESPAFHLGELLAHRLLNGAAPIAELSASNQSVEAIQQISVDSNRYFRCTHLSPW